MGMFINKGKRAFQVSRNSEYVDKSGLISVVNGVLFTRSRFLCVSRCRRFGKSMAARMLCAYYDKSCNSRELFADLEIACDPSFEKHLNQYRVIYLDMTSFVSRYKDDSIVERIKEELRTEILEAYPQVEVRETDDLMRCLFRIYQATGEQFVFIIDEWDAICREFPKGTKAMDDYVGWLRSMFKTGTAADVFAGVYMTGILPIKKYKTESALNNFQEYSMEDPGDLAPFFGFTKEEVRVLAEKYGMDFDKLLKWYGGYQIGDELSMFHPNSVMQALRDGICFNNWTKTGAFAIISNYITMNFDGLKDDIVAMIARENRKVDPTAFQNEMALINTKDDALTVLIHLGYLSYNCHTKECSIPNYEVSMEMENAVENTNLPYMIKTLQQSKLLLQATLNGDAEVVARGLDAAHNEHASILSYDNENSMACLMDIAYYYARNDYIIDRDLTSSMGFADLVLYPRKFVNSPTIVLELNYDKDADAAFDQMHRRRYLAKVAQYTTELLLVGVNYDKETKTHSCVIERWENE